MKRSVITKDDPNVCVNSASWLVLLVTRVVFLLDLIEGINSPFKLFISEDWIIYLDEYCDTTLMVKLKP